MSVNKRSNETITRVEGKEMVMERFFMAPPELVFSTYTDPEHIKNWWGPVGWETTTYQMDVRPGGIWHYCMRSEDGQEAWGKSVYQTVETPTRLVYTDVFSDEHGNESDELPAMTITVEFAVEGNGTQVVSHTLFDSEESLNQVKEMGAVEGMTQTFNRLEDYLNTL